LKEISISALVSEKSPVVLNSTFTSPSSTSGVRRNFSIRTSFTGSIQTVCQIPVVRVYQMPSDCSFQNCFPLGMVSSVDGSSTFTTISSFSQFKNSVILQEKDVWPPS